MGRELRRKEERKNKNNKNSKVKEELDSGIKASTAVKIIVVSSLILVILYYMVAVFITKEINVSWVSDEETTNGDSDSSNSSDTGVENKILAKNIFNQSEESYYVYFYDFSDEDEVIANVINSSDLTVYRVDTGSALNKNYVVEDGSNQKATSLSNLKVVNNTVIKIEADKITAYYEGSSAIIDLFG